ncbi:hypothetical protein PINS_up000546 [Pythium insidiosum]|nr:hypothetical protein PINS_up000546 [Pythium insidiosum]
MPVHCTAMPLGLRPVERAARFVDVAVPAAVVGGRAQRFRRDGVPGADGGRLLRGVPVDGERHESRVYDPVGARQEFDYGTHRTGISRTSTKDNTNCGYRIIALFVEKSGEV